MSHDEHEPLIPELTRAQLEQLTKPQLIDIVMLLQARVRQLEEQNRRLEARVEELERRLGMNSGNSSKPPSSDPPWKNLLRRKKPKSGRDPGGQPGHEGSTRSMLPVTRVDRLQQCVPDRCAACGAKLGGQDPSPLRFQWWELPKVAPTLHEVQLHRLGCRCGAVTCGALPPGVPRGAFGPSVQALVGLLTGVYHLSKRKVERLFEDVFGLEISLGSIPACEAAVSQALAVPVQEAREYVRRAPVVYADETGWRQGNRRAWLWVAATSLVTVFLVHARRGRDAARELLGDFKGVLVSDRWNAYRYFKGLRQLCWAHLVRAFEGFSEYRGEAGRIGKRLVQKARLMFKWWHKIRDGTLSRRRLQKRMERHRREVERLLARGEEYAPKGMHGACVRLRKSSQHLWTFVDVAGVEPTNNAAERALRPAVLWRKGSFGVQSESGARFVERVLTAAETCRQQRRSVLQYLVAACQARLHGQLAPSLLPLG